MNSFHETSLAHNHHKHECLYYKHGKPELTSWRRWIKTLLLAFCKRTDACKSTQSSDACTDATLVNARGIPFLISLFKAMVLARTESESEDTAIPSESEDILGCKYQPAPLLASRAHQTRPCSHTLSLTSLKRFASSRVPSTVKEYRSKNLTE